MDRCELGYPVEDDLIPPERCHCDIKYEINNCKECSRYNSESVITEYLDSHLEEGIKQENLDKILDLIDEYVELKEQNNDR